MKAVRLESRTCSGLGFHSGPGLLIAGPSEQVFKVPQSYSAAGDFTLLVLGFRYVDDQPVKFFGKFYLAAQAAVLINVIGKLKHIPLVFIHVR